MPMEDGGSEWLHGGGEIADLIRSRDWSQTPLGPREGWPASLRTAVSLALASSFPINVVWGPGAVQIWNEAFAKMAGAFHPTMFGSDFRVCWTSIWSTMGAPFESALMGVTAGQTDQQIFLDRHGFEEETWFTFALSPIYGDDGELAGVFHPVAETTATMLAQRRARTLRDLTERSATERSTAGVLAAVSDVFAAAAGDLPLAALYLADAEDGTVRQVAGTGISSDRLAAVGVADLGPASPVRAAIAEARAVDIDVAAHYGTLAAGAYPEPLQRAVALPVIPFGAERPIGALVLAVSTRLPFDDPYRVFFDLVAQGVSGALTRALAHETEQRLESLNEELADAVQAKGQFLASMSHEIRTPMNAIIGMTSLLLDSELTPAQAEYASVVRTSGEHLLSVITAILDFSKIDADLMLLDEAPFDVRRCAESAIEIVGVAAAAKGIELTAVVGEDVPSHVVGDAGRLRQVLVNLLGNAIKFTDSGNVALAVDAGEPDEDGLVELSYAITDTGIGITPEDQARLFEPFVQADSGSTRAHQGTGLGLAISRRLAGLMGGDIGLTSAVGVGSTFRLTITAPVDAAPPEEHVPDVAGLAGRRILVVDDNAVALRIARDYALGWSMDPVCVSSAGAALGLLRAGERFDVALVDWLMPEVSGPDLIAQIRATPDLEDLPVVLLSSANATRQQLAGITSDRLQLHLKPIRPLDLEAALATALVDTAPAPAVHEVTYDPVTAATHPLRILVVDDNDINRLVMTRILERLGYHPDVAADGVEALAACVDERYDLVFMDIEMPVLNGYDAARRIRSDTDGTPRIVGLSAHATDEARTRCLEAGMDTYLTKPLVAAQLIEEIGVAAAAVRG